MAPRIIGVHRVEATEPVHLIEIDLSGVEDRFDWGAVTQADPESPRDEWQVAYEEQSLGGGRWVFFFHWLRLDSPLETGLGALPVPTETPAPERLRAFNYEPP